MHRLHLRLVLLAGQLGSHQKQTVVIACGVGFGRFPSIWLWLEIGVPRSIDPQNYQCSSLVVIDPSNFDDQRIYMCIYINYTYIYIHIPLQNDACT